MATEFSGKTALVTGASAGFGEAIALQLAEAGCKVLAVARREERLNALQKKNSKIIPLVCDLQGDLKELRTIATKEKVGLLINNAGLALGRGSISETTDEQINTMIDTNVKALIAVTKIFLPGMIDRNDGDIVNLGSIAGLFTYPGGSIYAATKFAVHALSQAWRQDLVGKNIRVIEINPGMAETEFSLVRFAGDKEKAKKVYEGLTPLSAKDIADTVLWTLSRPRHVSIQNVVIMPTDQASVSVVHRKS